MGNMGKLMNFNQDFSTKAISTGHNKGFTYYFTLIIPFEIGILLLSLIGLFYFKKNKFSYFLIIWTLSTLIIFSIISYKANWIMPVIIIPMVLLAGNTIDYLSKKSKTLTIIGGILLLLITLFFSIQQNFVVVNDFERNKVGYVETSTEINNMILDINGYSGGKSTKILITAHSYWPMPSYLMKHNLMYLTEIEELNASAYPQYDIFIVDINQLKQKFASFESRDYEIRNNYKIRVLFRRL